MFCFRKCGGVQLTEECVNDLTGQFFPINMFWRVVKTLSACKNFGNSKGGVPHVH